MIKVACLTLIFMKVSARPQGGFHQFAHSSQSFVLNTENNEDKEDNNLDAFHSIPNNYEHYKENNVETSGFKFDESKTPEHFDHHNDFKNYGNHETERHNFNEHFGPHEHHHQHDDNHKQFGHHDHHDLLKYPEYPEHYDYHEQKQDQYPKQHRHQEQHQQQHQYEDHNTEHKKHEEHEPKLKYEFSYDVGDPHSGDYKTHHESRVGDTVHGFYTIHEADGTTRVVEYTSDDHEGFKAKVKHEGHVTHEAPK